MGGRGGETARQSRIVGVVGLGLVLSLGLAMFVAPFACPWPDGLEKVAKLGFEHRNRAVLWAPALADYAVPGCKSPRWRMRWPGPWGDFGQGLGWRCREPGARAQAGWR